MKRAVDRNAVRSVPTESRLTHRATTIGLALALMAGTAHADIGETDRLNPAAFRQVEGLATRSPLTLETTVDIGDRLTTDRGGLVGIRLADGSRLTVGPNSDVLLDAFSFQAAPDDRLGIALGRGVLRFVTGRMLPSGIEIATPSATLGIRGTDVVIAVAGAGTTRVTVLDGSVFIERDDGASAEISAGSSAVLSPGLPSIAVSDVIDTAIADPLVDFDDDFEDDVDEDLEEDEIDEDEDLGDDEDEDDLDEDDFGEDDDDPDDDDERDDENDDDDSGDDGSDDDDGNDNGSDDDDGNDDDNDDGGTGGGGDDNGGDDDDNGGDDDNGRDDDDGGDDDDNGGDDDD